jgi:hypothetical protein
MGFFYPKYALPSFLLSLSSRNPPDNPPLTLTVESPSHLCIRRDPAPVAGKSTSESRHEQFPFPSLDLSSCCFNLSCR